MLDIRMPIGGMFALLGGLLAIYGLATAGNAEMYRRSGEYININLWWGLVMAVFGGAMLFFGRRASRRS